jgi:hypothetical protein
MLWRGPALDAWALLWEHLVMTFSSFNGLLLT